MSHSTVIATAPLATSGRMDVLDVLRGVAVSAILLVNVGSLSGHDFVDPPQAAMLPWAQHDGTAAFLLELLVTGKFYCLFSLLFGVGFSVFIQRARAKEGADAIRRFKRRMLGLLIIGLVHTFLIWYGDILVLYAVLGLLLTLFLEKDDRALLRWAFGMLALPVAIYGVLLALAAAAPGLLQPQIAGGDSGEQPPILLRAVQGFTAGSYVDIVSGNAVLTAANVARRVVLMFFPRVFGMFLLGLYAGRSGFFANLGAHAALLRRVFWCGLAAGLPLAYLHARLGASPGGGLLPTLARMVVESIATPGLTLAYTAGLCLLFLRAGTLLRSFAPAGRMALSNYLTQSIAGIVIFYGIGLGWYGRGSLTMLLVGSAGFCAVQMIASRVWLAYAAYGPAEWAWRMFTYGRRLPLLRARGDKPSADG